MFHRSVSDVNDDGISLDIDVNLHFTPAWSAQLNVTDLFSRIYWKNLPETEAEVTSDRKEFDSDGYIYITKLFKLSIG